MDSRRELNDRDDAAYANDAELPLRDLYEEWRPQLIRADRQLRQLVRRNPIAALATMAVAGFLLGRLLRR
jgi:hypothetical protein